MHKDYNRVDGRSDTEVQTTKYKQLEDSFWSKPCFGAMREWNSESLIQHMKAIDYSIRLDDYAGILPLPLVPTTGYHGELETHGSCIHSFIHNRFINSDQYAVTDSIDIESTIDHSPFFLYRSTAVLPTCLS